MNLLKANPFVKLVGSHISLVPLEEKHAAELRALEHFAEIFRWFPRPVKNASDMDRYIDEAIRARNAGSAVPFVTILNADQQIIGSTRFMAIDTAHRRVEIGSTWLVPKWQRTFANSEAKYLMLEHAFEELKCVRVEFKTDSLNARSRKALERLGAKEEGTLRQHMVVEGGRLRDSVYFSILPQEWALVRERLLARVS